MEILAKFTFYYDQNTFLGGETNDELRIARFAGAGFDAAANSLSIRSLEDFCSSSDI